MENQPTALDKAVKISIIAGALIIALSIAYYLVIFMPQKEKSRVEQQKQEQNTQLQEKETRADNLNKCLEKNRENQLNTNLGFGEMQKAGKISNTDLDYMVDENNKRTEKDKNDCFRKYPQ